MADGRNTATSSGRQNLTATPTPSSTSERQKPEPLSAKVIHILNCHFPTHWASENLRERVIEFGEDVANQAPVNQELLEALKAIKELLGEGSRYAVAPTDGGTIDLPELIRIGGIFEKADAAIAKATGEVQP